MTDQQNRFWGDTINYLNNKKVLHNFIIKKLNQNNNSINFIISINVTFFIHFLMIDVKVPVIEVIVPPETGELKFPDMVVDELAVILSACSAVPI